MHINYYNERDGFEYTLELEYKEIREAVAEIFCDTNRCWNDKKIIEEFIYQSDLEDDVFRIYEEDLKEHFKNKARQEYNQAEDEEKMNPELYDTNYNIHGGV